MFVDGGTGKAERSGSIRQASARTSRSFAAKASGSPRLAVLAAEEAAVVAREDHRRRAEPLGDGLGAAVGHLALRLDAGGEHDPGRGRAQRVEVGLVVRAGDDVLAEQRVGPGAVVLGRQPEHRRIGRRLGGELRR